MALRKLIGVLFALALLWGLAVFASVEPHAYCRLFVFLLIPALLALWVVPTEYSSKPSFLCVLCAGALLLLQIWFKDSLGGTGYIVVSLGWLGLFLTLALSQGSPRALRYLFLLLVMLGGLEAAYGLIQSIGGWDSIGTYVRGLGRTATGTFVNRNHFAGLLNMTIPLALGGLSATFAHRGGRVRSEAYAWAWIILLSTGFMGLAILLSLSRGGVLTLMASLVFLTILLTLHSRRRRGRRLSGAAGWILLLLVLGLGVWVGIDALLERFSEEDALTDRRIIYRDSLRLIAAHPVLGVGPRMYRWWFRPYQTLVDESWYTYAHNDYLQTAAEWGIPLAAAFWGFVLWRLFRSAKVFFSSRDPWRQGIALGCAGAIFSILLHSFVDFNLQIPMNWVIFCIILGLSWVNESRDGWEP